LKLVEESEIIEKLASLGSQANFIDTDFAPNDNSIQHTSKGQAFDRVIQWRRPKEFMEVDPTRGLNEPEIFYKLVEPADITQGQLGNCWFLCALACMAERPALIERLFTTQSANEQGVYKVKMCKGGLW
jgi:calpain-15